MAGSIISLADGSAMTADFREKFPNETKAVYYSSNVFTDLIAQDGCVGIRIYSALDADGNLTNVLVGVDEHEDDLYRGIVYDSGRKSPPAPLSPNPLNS
ncbi:MAG: hypothetical protein RIS20_1214 [Bacteroidota bacterium]|jgi:hypothetical protein